MKQEIAILMGSKSDLSQLQRGLDLLEELKVPYTVEVISAHRNPDKLRAYCRQIEKQGIKVVIACAGLACALPGFIASYVSIPVIGVPLSGGLMHGLDSLFSIVQVPKGIGLVSSGIGKRGFLNALIFAFQILGLQDKKYLDRLKEFKKMLMK